MTSVVDRVRIERWSGTRPLTEEQDRWLKDGMTEVMPDLRMRELLELRPDLFREPEHLVVARDADADVPLAVLGSSWLRTGVGDRFLHIGVQFVAARSRGGDIFRRSWVEHMAAVVAGGHFPVWSALKTFNPVAYCAMRDYGRLPGAVMYPEVQMGSVGRDAELDTVARRIAGTLAPRHRFDPEVGVIRDIGVPRDLYRERPRCRDERVDAHFAEHVAAGDRQLCVVHVRSKRTEDAIMAHFAGGGG
ncbi:MAG: hypothetical protein ACJ73E_15890 [Mycobacteriales bacterium]